MIRPNDSHITCFHHDYGAIYAWKTEDERTFFCEKKTISKTEIRRLTQGLASNKHFINMNDFSHLFSESKNDGNGTNDLYETDLIGKSDETMAVNI